MRAVLVSAGIEGASRNSDAFLANKLNHYCVGKWARTRARSRHISGLGKRTRLADRQIGGSIDIRRCVSGCAGNALAHYDGCRSGAIDSRRRWGHNFVISFTCRVGADGITADKVGASGKKADFSQVRYTVKRRAQ